MSEIRNPATARKIRFDRFRHHGAWFVGCAVTALLTWSVAVMAGPKLPGKSPLVDPLQSLAELQRVAVRIIDPPRQLQVSGMTGTFIRSLVVERLEENGVKVVESPTDVPVLAYRIYALTGRNAPNQVACLFQITLEQEVHIPRLDQTLKVPTYVGAVGGVTTQDKLPDFAGAYVEKICDVWLDYVAAATTQRKATKLTPQ